MPGAHAHAVQGVIGFGPFRLFADERRIERSGEPLELGGRAMDILIALLERAGDVVSQRELIDQVWPNVTVDDSNLRSHVSALRRALGDGRDGARYVINIPGRGYCFVSPTTRSPGAAAAPAPPLAAAAAIVIPPRLRRMVGRDAAVEAIAAQLVRRRFVTIVGPGGIGKTTVAVSVGRALADQCGGACFVDLAVLTDPRLVPSLLATALGLIVQSDDPIPGLIGFLRSERMLLILDGCEPVIEAAAALAEAIFAQAEEVHILATSREALRIEGEHVHRLAPLDCPPASETLTAAEALVFPAVQLFADRVAASSGRLLQDSQAPIAARICRKLDGIALAIELAAGRVDAYGIAGVETLLGSRLSLLWEGRRTAPSRHHTLTATLGWSYDLLTEAERAVLRRLAVFAGPFTLEAAEAVAQDNDAATGEIVEVVASLVAKSLISADTGDGRGLRYRLLDATRTYLQEKLSGTDEADGVARRHAAFFCRLLKWAGAQSGPGAQASGALADHLGNVRAALEWSFSDHGDAGLGVALVAAAAPLFLELSLLTECRHWAETALAAQAAAEADPRSEMELQAALGLARLHTEGNSDTALDTLKRAVELAEGLGELGPQLQLIGALHMFHTRIGNFRGSIPIALRALEVARAIGDPTGVAEAEWMLGLSHHLMGDQTLALLHSQGALLRPVRQAQVVRLGLDQRICAICVLGRAQWLTGSMDEAVDTVQYALAEAEALGHSATLCTTLFTCATVYAWIGNLPEVEATLERMISVAEKASLAPYH